jgi:3-amino-5-hydroxybenzoate synthase
MAREELKARPEVTVELPHFPPWPMYDEREIAGVTRVLESRQWWRVAGSEVVEFEREFARYHDAGHALAVTNGTQAIEVALQALGVGHGDEVIIPAFTFMSTAGGVLSINAIPVLVDVDETTYCVDPQAVEAAITPRTRAILPVHMAGHVANMDALLAVARRHNLLVIEDAAHAQGARWKGAHIGTLHAGSIFSFQAGKLMTAGEGGLIMSNDAEFVERCFLFASCGRPSSDRTYQHSLLGTNCRMSELHAAVLRVQLTRLAEQNARREANAERLDELLGAIPGIEPQGRDPRVTCDPHYMYMFRYDPAAFHGLSRQEFVDSLIRYNVPAYVGYPAIHHTPLFRQRAFGPRWRPDDPLLPDYSRVHCPVAERLGDEVVWLHHRVLLGDHTSITRLADLIWALSAGTPFSVEG